QLVELMGGSIGALSRPGEGSTLWFTLRLPRQQASPERVLASGDLTGARVLIVDDNALNRRVLHEQLGSWRVRDGVCASGAEALQMLREAQAAGDPYALAILDYQMPDMDGEMLGRAIKADPALGDTLLLMLTSLGQKGDVERLKAIGFAAYLGKPVRQADLFEALVKLWSTHTQRRPAAMVTRHSLAEARAAGRVPARPRFDAQVLLVEDNLTNQQVAVLMLRTLGCRVDVAGNGREALRMVQAAAYDLLFMDCEMPEMDGFEAAAAIRRRGDGKAQTPIVAVTAQAMQGDRERCLKAGMNDYISKPVQLEAFAAALKRWAPSRLGPAGGAMAAERRETASGLAALSLAGSGWSAALDVEVIGGLRDLAAATDHDFLQQILQSFLHDGVERIRAMRAALGAGEAEALRQAAHTLRGACRSVGARHMAPIAQQLEELGLSGTLVGALTLIEQLEEAFAQVKAAIGALGVGNEQQGEHSS
ncbi:MAG: response regulator, partial [Pseudomonas sp.]